MTTWITICDTCKREGWDEGDMAQTDGEKLATLIEDAAAGSAVKTRRVSCLMVSRGNASLAPCSRPVDL